MSDRSRGSSQKPENAHVVLVVEPDVLVRMAVADYLRECGYRVLEASSANEALKILRAKYEAGVVFSEVKLPGSMDGFALAQQIRREFPGIEMLLTTGAKMAATQGGELCDDGPIEKPYHHEQILKRLALLLQRQKNSKT